MLSTARPRSLPAPRATDAAQSWYAVTANPCPSFPKLEGAKKHDVVIVGAGFTGLSVALELAAKGFDIAIVEAKTVGWGASGRNGGQVVTGFTKSLHEVARLVGKTDARRLWEMAEEGKRLVQERIARHAIPCGYQPGYMYAAVKASHEHFLRDMLESWHGYGYQGARWLDAQETRALVDCPYYRGGIYDRENGHLHPLNYAIGLANAAVSAGVTIYENSPVLEVREGSLVVLTTPAGSVTASHVVLAGNALLGPVSRSVARAVNSEIVPVATYIIATEPMRPAEAEAIIPGNIAVSDVMFVVNYFRRTPDNRILFGGGLDWSGLTFKDVTSRMLGAMHKWLPRTKGCAAEYSWGGYVDMTANMLPSLGRVSRNVYYVHGFSGNGITLTGIAGRVTAEAIAGTAERFDVFSRIPTPKFPGGPFGRQPIAAAGALWYKLKDLLP